LAGVSRGQGVEVAGRREHVIRPGAIMTWIIR
jgi:hypothetical protein